MERSVVSVYDRLKQLEIKLPAVTAPGAVFAPYVRSGQLMFLSGHIAKRNGKPWTGKMGEQLQTDEGKQAERGIAIDLIGTLHAATGNLDKVSRILKLMVLVNSALTFTEQHLVANGASELLVEVFGDAGAHARSAFGVEQVPFGSRVEIDLIAEVK
jgi:enamine deaminase RidA (YjgF/YER057c/UK114 family)